VWSLGPGRDHISNDLNCRLESNAVLLCIAVSMQDDVITGQATIEGCGWLSAGIRCGHGVSAGINCIIENPKWNPFHRSHAVRAALSTVNEMPGED
jgi:hypothetical protein